ncbi:MAG: hypothetical protein LPK19_04120, partial [Hymenobacteraceae bacterium]|nr:hypothetical protein [Hymenobacteraceae bacterium]MDX5395383.1 hypothetical protein [Hymenobacteraceae bacterium]MDX5511432.1 hypothetical protein [Hymenobacteraceae bacterium]
MGVIKKQSIQNTIISYAGVALGYINLVLLFPKFLPEEEVGLTRILLQVSVLYAQLSAIGFANVGTRFFPYFRDKEQKNHGFLTFLLGVPLISFIFLTLLFLISKNELLYFFTVKYPKPGSELLSEYYFLIVPLAFFTLYFNLFSAYLAALYKTVVPSFTNEVLLRVLITISIGLYAFNLIDFGQFVYLFIGVNCTVAVILATYLLWLSQLKLPINKLIFRIKPLREMLHFGFFAFL